MRTLRWFQPQLHLLGGWQITAAVDMNPSAERIDVPPDPQHLIALLALKGQCARSDAAAMLWPDTADEVASARGVE